MKRSPKIVLLLMLLVSTFLGAIGQLLFKYAMPSSGILASFLFAGILAYVSSSVIYIYVLSRSHLSWTYGMGGLSYLFAVLLAALLLHETVTLVRWSGVLAIAVGAAFVGLS